MQHQNIGTILALEFWIVYNVMILTAELQLPWSQRSATITILSIHVLLHAHHWVFLVAVRFTDIVIISFLTSPISLSIWWLVIHLFLSRHVFPRAPTSVVCRLQSMGSRTYTSSDVKARYIWHGSMTAYLYNCRGKDCVQRLKVAENSVFTISS